jgi:hypothetical protein
VKHDHVQIALGMFIALVMLCAGALLHCAGSVHAQMSPRRPIPTSQWTGLAGASLAHLIRNESRSGKDFAAIAWTVARRWYAHSCTRERFDRHIIRTSRYTRRARPWLEHEAAHGLRSDPELRADLDRWAAGDVPDPCRGQAMQWRAPGVGGPGRRVRCGDTSNAFYEHPRAGQARAMIALARGREVCR